MATRAEALRVLHAVTTVNADAPRPLGEPGEPVLVDNYCCAPGVSGFGITWTNGPIGWARNFYTQRDEYLKTLDPNHQDYKSVNTDEYADLYAEDHVLTVL